MSTYRYDRQLALNMWSEGKSAREIADVLVAAGGDTRVDELTIKGLLTIARKAGDARAACHQRQSSAFWVKNDDLLRQYWTEGHSCSQIAAKLGHPSRNAVIGRAYRLKLAPRARSRAESARMGGHAMRMKRRVAGNRVGGLGAAIKKAQRRMTPFLSATRIRVRLPAEPILPPDCKPVTLMDHVENQCAWPIGESKGPETLFCGAPKVGEGSWCIFHRALGFSPRAPRIRYQPLRQGQIRFGEVPFSG